MVFHIHPDAAGGKIHTGHIRHIDADGDLCALSNDQLNIRAFIRRIDKMAIQFNMDFIINRHALGQGDIRCQLDPIRPAGQRILKLREILYLNSPP